MTTGSDDRIKVSAGGPTLDAGVYEAELANYEIVDGKFGKQRRVDFTIETEDEPTEISAYINDKGGDFRPLSNGYKLIGALLDDDPIHYADTHENMPGWKQLLGKRLRITVTEEKREDGSTFSKVTGYMPLKKKETTRLRQALRDEYEPPLDDE